MCRKLKKGVAINCTVGNFIVIKSNYQQTGFKGKPNAKMLIISPEYAKPLPNAEIIKKEFQETLQQNAKLKN